MNDNRAAWTPLSGLESLTTAWMTAFMPARPGEGGLAVLAARLLDPRQWLGIGGAAVEQPFETILGLPRLADVPDVHRNMLALLRGWLGVAQRGTEYGAVVSQVWLAVYADFLVGLHTEAVAGRPVASGQDLLYRWTTAVNERLLKAQRSEPFLQAQGRLLDAMLTSRAAERWLVDAAAKLTDMPGRGEMDDVHKSLHEVKRELRALRRRLADAEEAASRPGNGR